MPTPCPKDRPQLFNLGPWEVPVPGIPPGGGVGPLWHGHLERLQEPEPQHGILILSAAQREGQEASAAAVQVVVEAILHVPEPINGLHHELHGAQALQHHLVRGIALRREGHGLAAVLRRQQVLRLLAHREDRLLEEAGLHRGLGPGALQVVVHEDAVDVVDGLVAESIPKARLVGRLSAVVPQQTHEKLHALAAASMVGCQLGANPEVLDVVRQAGPRRLCDDQVRDIIPQDVKHHTEPPSLVQIEQGLLRGRHSVYAGKHHDRQTQTIMVAHNPPVPCNEGVPEMRRAFVQRKAPIVVVLHAHAHDCSPAHGAGRDGVAVPDFGFEAAQ
mmetsp:Transcript_99787/g.291162  ORF Transcript_99787/g.291162 Transcript_99787/m.291162 type:complete len:331 (+) Transcript_99787:61-1053(+)